MVTAMIFALKEKRRLIVDDGSFNGYRWSDFFQSALPGDGANASVVAEADVVRGGASPAFWAMYEWLAGLWTSGTMLDFPEIGLSGSAFEVKRALTAPSACRAATPAARRSAQ